MVILKHILLNYYVAIQETFMTSILLRTSSSISAKTKYAGPHKGHSLGLGPTHTSAQSS